MQNVIERGGFATDVPVPPFPPVRRIEDTEPVADHYVEAGLQPETPGTDSIRTEIDQVTAEIRSYISAPGFESTHYAALIERRQRLDEQLTEVPRKASIPVQPTRSASESTSHTSRETAEAEELDVNQAEALFEAVVTDDRLSTEQKLGAVESLKQSLLESAGREKQIVDAQAAHIEYVANEQADGLHEQAHQQAARKQAEADTKAGAALNKGESDAEEFLGVVNGQIQVVRQHQQLLTTTSPHMWPKDLAKVILNYDCDKRLRNAAIEAEGVRRGGQDIAARILKEAGDEITALIDEAVRRAETMRTFEREHAERIRQDAAEAHRKLVEGINRIYQSSVLKVRGEDKLDKREDQGTRTNAAAAGILSVDLSGVRSVPVDISLLKTDRGLKSSKNPVDESESADASHALESEDEHSIRPLPEQSIWRHRRVQLSVAAGVITATLLGGTIAAAELHGGSRQASVEQMVERDSKVPTWAPASVKAWQNVIADAVKNPAVSHGGPNYMEGGQGLGGGLERTMFTAMMLSSAGDPTYSLGLFDVDKNTLAATAKAAGLTFDPNKPDHKVEAVLVARIINDSVDKAMADEKQKAAIEQAYAKNKDRTLVYQVIANGLGVPKDSTPYFVDFCNQWDAPKSDAFNKLYSDPTWKAAYDQAAAALQKAGMLPGPAKP